MIISLRGTPSSLRILNEDIYDLPYYPFNIAANILVYETTRHYAQQITNLFHRI